MIKQFNPQPTGNTAQDNNNKQLREIIDAIIQLLLKLNKG
jgi:hypothetical protein